MMLAWNVWHYEFFFHSFPAHTCIPSPVVATSCSFQVSSFVFVVPSTERALNAVASWTAPSLLLNDIYSRFSAWWFHDQADASEFKIITLGWQHVTRQDNTFGLALQDEFYILGYQRWHVALAVATFETKADLIIGFFRFKWKHLFSRKCIFHLRPAGCQYYRIASFCPHLIVLHHTISF